MSQENIEDIVSDMSPEETARIVAELVQGNSEPELEPMDPQGAVDRYLDTRDDLRVSTRNSHSSGLSFFVRWCENVAGIENMNDLSGSLLNEFYVWRRDESSDRVDKLSRKTQETQQKIIKTFIEHCETWNFVPERLSHSVYIPILDDEDEVRDEVLEKDTVNEILNYLHKFSYASLEHVTWLLLASCGARVGGIHALDVEDFVSSQDGAYLSFRHRPETGTPLKNKIGGERDVDLDKSVASVLGDYIECKREDTTDEHGRNPLLSSRWGRVAKSTMRNYIYKWTRPCSVGNECPFGEDPDECEAAERTNTAHKCPGSLSCHPVRKGYITSELKAGVPQRVVSERCNVSKEVMDKHYDYRSKKEKMEARRMLLQQAHRINSGYLSG